MLELAIVTLVCLIWKLKLHTFPRLCVKKMEPTFVGLDTTYGFRIYCGVMEGTGSGTVSGSAVWTACYGSHLDQVTQPPATEDVNTRGDGHIETQNPSK